MNERSARLWEQASARWGRWNQLQKAALVVAAGAGIAVLTLLGAARGAGANPADRHAVPLIGAPIADQQALLSIAARLDQEGADYEIGPDNRILVADQDNARRLRAILIREDLIPPRTDPFAVFDVDRFSITDFERNVNLQRALTRNLEQHIAALDDVVAARVTLVVPETELFAEDQNPTTASIIITPRPGSDILENRKKVAGVQRLVQFAVAGLRAENIVILDPRGMQVNEFADPAGHGRMTLVERQLNTKHHLEQRYKREILTALGNIFTLDRVQIVRLDIDLDLSAELTVSEQTEQESFQGAAPEPAAAGGEGSSVARNEVSRRSTITEKSPWAINRVTVSVALDGVWRPVFEPDGRVVVNADGSVRRDYTPVSADELRKAALLIEGAVGWDRRRGDSVTVEHLQFDRTRQFQQEDALLRREAELLRLLPAAAAGAAALLAAAVLSWWLGRRRRARAAHHSGLRPARLRAAARSGRARDADNLRAGEMRRNAANLARERPADAARAVRTWLAEK